MKLEALDRLDRHTRRLAEIVAVLSKYGIADWLGGLQYEWFQERLRSFDGQRLGDLTTEARIRLALTELGTTFIKLGQMLSTRGDIVGQDLAMELTQLQANVPAEPASTVRKTIGDDFGRSVEELFASFEDEPIASASIAQVHGATLKGGGRVVVKVQHDGISAKVVTDLEIVMAVAELAEKYSPLMKPYQPVAIVRQFRRVLLREMDFTYERRNLEEFARNFADDPTVHIPGVMRELCSRRVVTMERLDGIKGTDSFALRYSNEDLAEFATRGANMYLEMVFRDSFYHADPHAGNLLLLPGAVVGVIDCGMVGRLDQDLRDDVEAILFAVVEGDSAELTELVLRIGAAPPACPRDRLRGDLDDFLSDYVGHSLHDINVGDGLSNLIEIIRRYHITLPPALAMLLKTLIMLEGTSRLFKPDISLAELMKPYYARSVRRKYSPRRVATKMFRLYRDWDRFLSMLPTELSDVLVRMRNHTFTIHLDHRHLDPVVNRLVLGVLTAAIFLGSAMLWSMKAAPTVYGISVFGVGGCMISVYLGYRLLRAVKKSGDIRSKD